MKRAVIFTVVFVFVYIALCYLVPGWRIKLDASPLVYFTASLQSMMLLKSGIAAVAALLVTLLIGRKECGR